MKTGRTSATWATILPGLRLSKAPRHKVAPPLAARFDFLYTGFVKKNILFPAVLSLFFSCGGNNWDNTVIANESDYTVTFKFNHTREYDLPAGGRQSFETKAYQYLESHSPEKRVCFKYTSADAGYTGYFRELRSWELSVRNTLDEDALSADGWMDETEIPAGDDKTGRIFTDKPVFTATTKTYPAVTSWRIEDDKMFVLIR